jgi:hypothetical protein
MAFPPAAARAVLTPTIIRRRIAQTAQGHNAERVLFRAKEET